MFLILKKLHFSCDRYIIKNEKWILFLVRIRGIYGWVEKSTVKRGRIGRGIRHHVRRGYVGCGSSCNIWCFWCRYGCSLGDTTSRCGSFSERKFGCRSMGICKGLFLRSYFGVALQSLLMLLYTRSLLMLQGVVRDMYLQL